MKGTIMNCKEKNLHVLECASLNIQEFANMLGYIISVLDNLKNAVSDVGIAYSLLEQAAEEIENLYGTENELTKKIREHIENGI